MALETREHAGDGLLTTVKPRIAFGSWAFAFGPFAADPWAFERVAAYVESAGYDGVEINGFRPHPHDEDYVTRADLGRLGDGLEARGLGISAFAPDLSAVPPADAELSEYLARIDSTLRFCRSLGVTTLRTDTISPPGPWDRDRFVRLTTAWLSAARRCADSGVQLVWEFEPGFWLNRPSEVVRVLDSIDHPSFGVLFDTSHAFTGAVMGARQGPDPELLPGGVAEYAGLLGDRILHLHLIDSDGSLHDNETSAHLPFGQGHIDFAATLEALPGGGLDLPWWTVDFCFWPNTEVDGRTAVPVVRDLINRTAGKGGERR